MYISFSLFVRSTCYSQFTSPCCSSNFPRLHLWNEIWSLGLSQRFGLWRLVIQACLTRFQFILKQVIQTRHAILPHSKIKWYGSQSVESSTRSFLSDVNGYSLILVPSKNAIPSWASFCIVRMETYNATVTTVHPSDLSFVDRASICFCNANIISRTEVTKRSSSHDLFVK